MINCGCSKFTVNNGIVELVDDEEWCEVETIIEYAEDDFGDFRGVIRASHQGRILKILILLKVRN